MTSVLRSLLLIPLLTATAAHADWSQRTLAGMQVQIYTPQSMGSYAGGRGLMIGLHGCTQQATALAQHGNWEAAAERRGVVVALPQVPNGGVIAGCWDYYGANHTRTTRHDGPVLNLVTALLGDAALHIDPDQVYVSGLSSGAGEAMVLGCLAPDVFAGVGVNAGPTIGTSSGEISTVSTDRATGVRDCKAVAGASSPGFDTQLFSVIAGTSDFLVAQGYAALDAEVMRTIYEDGQGAFQSAPIDVPQLIGSTPQGTGTLWSDPSGPRVSLIMVQGMGHAFPAGNGTGAEMSFIAQRGPSWPDYLLDLFTLHNRRVGGAPLVDAGTPRVDSGTTPADAGSPPADAGFVLRDGGLVAADAAPPHDAGAGADRAPNPGPDAGLASVDGALPDPDGGSGDPDMKGGCSCSSSTSGLPEALLGGLFVLPLALLRRRSRRAR